MRLTLRTLLAYMDGLLDAKDSQEIGKKIEDSKFASELFHKIRDVMRRLRLAAPSLTERAANLDCNTVAEYLDNVLPADRVPDFEEVSLKSEMHLAEVASCHQILTMVLGEPVEIDPDSRQRMYQLPTVANRVDEEHLAAVEAASMLSGDGNVSGPLAPSVKARPRPVVPEYLRDPPRKSRLLPAAAIMFLAGAAICLLLIALHQFDAGTPLGNGLNWLQAKLHGKQDDEDRDDRDGKKFAHRSGEPVAGPNETAAPNGGAAPKSSDAAPAVPPNEPGVPPASKDTGNPLRTADKSEVPVPPADQPPDAVPHKGPDATGTVSPPPSVVTTPPTPESKPADSEKPAVASVAGPTPKGVEPKTPRDNPAVRPLPLQPSGELAKVDSNPLSGALSKSNTTLPAVGPASRPPLAEDKKKIGRFMSEGQDVLLKLETRENAGWRRVLPEEFLASHQPLLALPSYRSRVVVLNVGASLELINGTRIELLPDNAQGQPGVDIDFGRMVIKPLAHEGARLRVVVGSREGSIMLTNDESIVGLEVTRVHEPGTDPEKVFSHALAKLYVARGGAVWEDAEGKPPLRLAAPAELMLAGAVADRPPGAVKEVPKWITVNTINELDQRAALSVSQALAANRAASLGLMELADPQEHRKENRWLAARCLGYLGKFEPMAAALNNVDFRREWPDYFDQLKEAIARGPETAAGIRQSLERQYGNDSAALYRMLWGYTDKDLAEGEDARLVKFLDHEVPAFRVLAFENLRAITQKTFLYHPETPTAAKRSQAVQQWQRQLQAGRIRFNAPEVKPRGIPSAPPPKGAIPEPPKPLEGDAAAGE